MTMTTTSPTTNSSQILCLLCPLTARWRGQSLADLGRHLLLVHGYREGIEEHLRPSRWPQTQRTRTAIYRSWTFRLGSAPVALLTQELEKGRDSR